MPRPALTLLSLALLALPAAAQETRPRFERPDGGHRPRVERQEAPQRREALRPDRHEFREHGLDRHDLRDRRGARPDDERRREQRKRALKHRLKERGVDRERLRELRDRLRDHPEARERIREHLRDRLRDRRDQPRSRDSRDAGPRFRRT